MLVYAVAALAGISAVALGGAVVALTRGRRDAKVARQRTLATGAEVAQVAPEPKSNDVLASTVGRLGSKVSKGGASRTLAAQLAAAGFHHPQAATIYLGAKAALFLLGLAGAALALASSSLSLLGIVFGAFFGGAVLSFVPNFVVSARRRARQKNVDRHLPDAVDLLEICVASGMGLDAAWAAVTDEIRGVSDLFADEMELTTLEISLGIPRAEAMRHMSARTGVEDLSSLVALLVQAEKLGASIADALTTFAKGLREARGQRAEESAEKMSVKLMFPMVMFIFPALLLIMLGPAVMQIVAVMVP